MLFFGMLSRIRNLLLSTKRGDVLESEQEKRRRRCSRWSKLFEEDWALSHVSTKEIMSPSQHATFVEIEEIFRQDF